VAATNQVVLPGVVVARNLLLLLSLLQLLLPEIGTTASLLLLLSLLQLLLPEIGTTASLLLLLSLLQLLLQETTVRQLRKRLRQRQRFKALADSKAEAEAQALADSKAKAIADKAKAKAKAKADAEDLAMAQAVLPKVGPNPKMTTMPTVEEKLIRSIVDADIGSGVAEEKIGTQATTTTAVAPKPAPVVPRALPTGEIPFSEPTKEEMDAFFARRANNGPADQLASIYGPPAKLIQCIRALLPTK
jgi:hypothetical protein